MLAAMFMENVSHRSIDMGLMCVNVVTPLKLQFVV